jgi:quercetin dioxygenase-like cupin family protein
MAVEKKNFAAPDDVTRFEKGKVDLVKLAAGTVGLAEMQPGWRWSEHVRPIAGTEWCEARHVGYVISGRLHVKMSNGEEFELGPGDVSELPPGHDAWVVGNEPYIGLDWTGMAEYARPR